MGYNLASEKMKKWLNKLILMALMVMGLQVSPVSLASENNNDEPIAFCKVSNKCISGVFRATEDNWTGTLALYSDCTFRFTDREGRDIQTTDGTYTMDGDIYPGAIAHITFYVGGENYGAATIAWPTEEGLQVWMNGYTFYKIAG